MSLLSERYGKTDIGNLGAIPHDEEGPVFNAPWEASAFAIAVKLSELGHFTWAEWVDTFSANIKAFEKLGVYDPKSDDGHHYYEIWLATLEKLITEKGILDSATLDERHHYLIDHPVPHDHVAKREPIFVA